MGNSFTAHQIDGVLYYTADAFSETGRIIHAFSARKGGVSTGKYESLNMSLLTADDRENVLANRRRLCQVIGVEPADLTGAQQVHGDQIYHVGLKDKGAGALVPGTSIAAVDALITKERGIPLVLFFADCVPVFFLDPVRQIVALAHAGWKGTVAGITAKTVRAMRENYGSDPRDILAAVGPSIGPCHYEVDGPVIDAIKEAFPGNDPGLLSPSDKAGHAQLNLWLANTVQLLEEGLPQDNISVAGLCTYCLGDSFFSHRRGMAGRQAAIIMLK
ncbi:MAG: peptidoglycan editing factor PgeF [Clostridia bacterium]|nr:peptidoglycan editing factor PgeF [Clostridia bacterium]